MWALVMFVALIPTIARAQSRFAVSNTPTQEYSRFRWTNSCASVCRKASITKSVVAVVGRVRTLSLDAPRPRWREASDDVAPVANVYVLPTGLRAPPSRTI
ncbi:MAG TPA: hypothetical protein VH583_03000 [Vicinamibacterales bacterium]|jgi:hypothetical protein